MTRIPASERRAALIDAALRVVSRNGLAQATTRAIVAEAGMSLASFHYAFESRDELVDELITTVIGREQQAVLPDPITGQTLREILEAGLLRYYEHLRADPEHEQAMLELAAKQSGARWRSPVDRVARVLVAFTDGLTLTWLVERDDDAARAVVAAAADALTRMADTR